MDTGLRGKVVVVTGAAAGIGRATALRFAREGGRVAGFDVNEAAGPGARRGDRQGGRGGALRPGGRGGRRVRRGGREGRSSSAGAAIDVLVNNAGILRDAQLVKWKDGAVAATMTDEAWDAVLGVNLRASSTARARSFPT